MQAVENRILSIDMNFIGTLVESTYQFWEIIAIYCFSSAFIWGTLKIILTL